MSNLEVLYNNRAIEEYSDEQYGPWSIHNDIEIYGIKLSDEYFDISVPFEVNKGDIVHLVYVSYETGDSFGHESGRHEYIAAYKTKEEAEKVVNLLINDFYYTKERNKGYLELPLGNGGTFTYSTSTYKGYFEDVERFDSVSLVVV